MPHLVSVVVAVDAQRGICNEMRDSCKVTICQNRLPWGHIRNGQSQQRLAGDTEQLCGGRAVFHNGEEFALTAAGAGRGGATRIRVRRNNKWLRSFADPRRLQFESRVAMVAHVIEAAGRLAGINDVRGTALRAGDGDGRE